MTGQLTVCEWVVALECERLHEEFVFAQQIVRKLLERLQQHCHANRRLNG